MVIAGAGSGKTRVLTYRIAHLIEKGVDPFNILALTFTNKAAREMKERIAKIIGSSEARNIWMGTFHSVFARILRVEGGKIGYPSNFTIYDTADSKNLLKSIIREMNLNDKLYKTGFVYNRISAAKNNLISPKGYRENIEVMNDDELSGRPKIGAIYTEYNRRLFQSHSMDFDDLLFNTNILLRDFPEVLYKYQHKFRYILVDEYQDTNYSQYLIVKQLAALNENICVVGDDAQSIYAFRGADIQNILNFKKDYPDYQLFKLEQNYRSTKQLVAAANSIISKNTSQIKKHIWTENEEGNRIKVHRAVSDNDEGKFVANDIFTKKSQLQLRNSDFAILYRTNAQSRSMEESLRKLNIPYRIYGGLSFYQRKEVKDLLAYFRLVANPNDEEALKRVINYPARGIGKTSLDKIIVQSGLDNTGLWNVIADGDSGLEIGGNIRSKLRQFVLMIESFRAQLDNLSAYDLGERIAKTTGLLGELYADKSPEGLSRYENITELLNGLKEFSDKEPEEAGSVNTLSDFLVDVALLTDADEQDDDTDKVSMMTIHSAKGLEFPYVYIVGMEENLFPSQLSLNTRTELEEERRLFYVAVTRAEKAATLSYAMSRYRWGNLLNCEPSRFITEIDAAFLELPESIDDRQIFQGSFSPRFGRSPRQNMDDRGGMSTGSRPQPSSSSVVPPRKNMRRVSASTTSDFVGDDLEKVVVGSEVEHEKFGKGKVLQLDGDFPNTKATVFFPAVGQKQLLLKFAKLKIRS